MFGQYALGEFSMGEPDQDRPFVAPVVMCAEFAALVAGCCLSLASLRRKEAIK